MSSQSTSTVNGHQAISAWWNRVRTRISLALELMNDENLLKPKDVQVTMMFLKKNYHHFEDAGYPPEAAIIREHMITAFNNLLQSLYYQQQNNMFQSSVRYDMAKSVLDNVRFLLLQSGIYE